MGTVTIICPRTGQRVSTGLSMSREEFDQVGSDRNVLRCPACGRVHEWLMEEAELEEDPPRPPNAEA